jgi:hypothetical protein
MRTFIAAVGTVLLLTLARGSTDFNLRGMARVGERPQANAVVWLEAPNAPARTPSQKTVLNQRNLSVYPHVLAVRVGTVVDFPNASSKKGPTLSLGPHNSISRRA